MATDPAQDDRDDDAKLATAVHRVLAILSDLRSEAQTPALTERIKLVQWLRDELADVEALLTRAATRRDPGLAPASRAADS